MRLSTVYGILIFGGFFLVSVSSSSDWRGPRDRFWRHSADHETLVYRGKEYYPPLKSCLKDTLGVASWTAIPTTRADDRAVGLILKDEYRSGKPILVSVERAMAPLHVKAIQALASCVRTVLPEFYEARPFYVEMGLPEDPGLGGNNPTHLAPLVGVFFPEIVEEMQRTIQLAYDKAGWSYYAFENVTKHNLDLEEVLPHPRDVGFRASEHLTYKDFKEGLDDHTDGSDTYYTVNYAFSGPEDYDGGFFYLRYGQGELWGDGEAPKEFFYIKPNRYDCLIFLGGPYLHGVTEMKGGNREMFSSEMWAYPDTPFGSNLWGNHADRMEPYIRACNQEEATQNSTTFRGPCKVSMMEFKEEPNDDKDGDEDEDEDEPIKNLSPGRVYDSGHYRSKKSEPYFLIPKPKFQSDGDLFPLTWRHNFMPVPCAHLLALPKSLVPSLQEEQSNLGLIETLTTLLYDIKTIQPRTTITVEDGTQWQAMALTAPEESDLIQFEPLEPATTANDYWMQRLQQRWFPPKVEEGKHQWTVIKSCVWAMTWANDLSEIQHTTRSNTHRLVIPIQTVPETLMGIGERGTATVYDDDDGIEWGEMVLDPPSSWGIFLGPYVPLAPSNLNIRDMKKIQLFWVFELDNNSEPLLLVHNDNTTRMSAKNTTIQAKTCSTTTAAAMGLLQEQQQ